MQGRGRCGLMSIPPMLSVTGMGRDMQWVNGSCAGRVVATGFSLLKRPGGALESELASCLLEEMGWVGGRLGKHCDAACHSVVVLKLKLGRSLT